MKSGTVAPGRGIEAVAPEPVAGSRASGRGLKSTSTIVPSLRDSGLTYRVGYRRRVAD